MSTKPSTPFTAREMELINIAFQSLKEKPIIDYELMALKADLVGAKSARDQFNKLYSKLTSANTNTSSTGALGGGGQVVEELSPTKKGASSKKRKADESLSTDAYDAEASSSTTKKKATTPRKGRKKKGKTPLPCKTSAKANKDEDDDAFDY